MRPKLGRKEVKDRDKKGEPETSTGRADDRRTELDLDAIPPPRLLLEPLLHSRIPRKALEAGKGLQSGLPESSSIN